MRHVRWSRATVVHRPATRTAPRVPGRRLCQPAPTDHVGSHVTRGQGQPIEQTLASVPKVLAKQPEPRHNGQPNHQRVSFGAAPRAPDPLKRTSTSRIARPDEFSAPTRRSFGLSRCDASAVSALRRDRHYSDGAPVPYAPPIPTPARPCMSQRCGSVGRVGPTLSPNGSRWDGRGAPNAGGEWERRRRPATST